VAKYLLGRTFDMLRVKNIHACVGRRHLARVSLSVRSHEVVCLVGATARATTNIWKDHGLFAGQSANLFHGEE